MVAGDGWTIEAVATPGHTANHMCYALKDKNLLFAGDHVMAWATSIVAPPDGAMSDYMASLDKLAKRCETLYLPGHGPAIKDAPRFVSYYILHRKAREASILHRLAKGETDIPAIVRAIYIGIDPRLTGAAGLSVLAHLEDLVARGLVATDGQPAIDGVYRLARLITACAWAERFLRGGSFSFLRLRRRRLRQRVGHGVVDVAQQRGDPPRIGAEIVVP